jgi:ATP adenylyltransferase
MANESRAQGWDILIDSIASSTDAMRHDTTGFLSSPKLPFTHFIARLPPSPTPSQLHSTYLSLHSTAVSAIKSFVLSNSANPESNNKVITPDPDCNWKNSSISYNLAMTTTTMAICPRRLEGITLRHGLDEGACGPGNGDDDNGSDGGGGFVEMNGTLLAGTLMVKDRWDWYVLREDPKRLDILLEAIGVPSPATAKRGSGRSGEHL